MGTVVAAQTIPQICRGPSRRSVLHCHEHGTRSTSSIHGVRDNVVNSTSVTKSAVFFSKLFMDTWRKLTRKDPEGPAPRYANSFTTCCAGGWDADGEVYIFRQCPNEGKLTWDVAKGQADLGGLSRYLEQKMVDAKYFHGGEVGGDVVKPADVVVEEAAGGAEANGAEANGAEANGAEGE